MARGWWNVPTKLAEPAEFVDKDKGDKHDTPDKNIFGGSSSGTEQDNFFFSILHTFCPRLYSSLFSNARATGAYGKTSVLSNLKIYTIQSSYTNAKSFSPRLPRQLLRFLARLPRRETFSLDVFKSPR